MREKWLWYIKKMIQRGLSFILLSGLLFAAPVLSQPYIQPQLLSVNEGLSQGMVFDILQTRDGFLWIATKDGLNRYDGYRFEVFANDPFDPFSIASSESWYLFEDSRGWIWIICPAGLDVFVPQSSRFFHILNQKVNAYIATKPAFTETSDGNIWLTLNGKVRKIDVAPGIIEKAAKEGDAYPGLPCKSIEAPGVTFTSIFLPRIRNCWQVQTTGFTRSTLIRRPFS